MSPKALTPTKTGSKTAIPIVSPPVKATFRDGIKKWNPLATVLIFKLLS